MFSEKTYSVVGLISLAFLYTPQIPVRYAFLYLTAPLSCLALSPFLLCTLTMFLSPRPERGPTLFAAHGSKAACCRQSYKESVNTTARPISKSSLRARCAATLAEPLPSSSRLVERQPCYNNSSDSEDPGFFQTPLPTKPRLRQPKRTRSSSNATSLVPKAVVTSIKVDPVPTSHNSPTFPSRKSISSPLLYDPQGLPPPYSRHPYPETPHMNLNSDTEDERNEDGMIYTSRLGNSARNSGSSQSLRSRIFGLASGSGSRVRDKPICTTPGMQCAGETETETDEPVSLRPHFLLIPTIRAFSVGRLFPSSLHTQST